MHDGASIVDVGSSAGTGNSAKKNLTPAITNLRSAWLKN
jgi:hypothetical protein